MPYHSIDEILRRCRDRACPFWQVVLTTQAKETQLPESAVLDQMDQMAKAMEDSITQYDPAAVPKVAARQRSALQPPWPPVVWYIWQGATTTPLPRAPLWR